MNSQNIIIYDYDDIFNILILVKENNNIKKILPNAYINRIVKIKNYPIKLENLIEILNVQLLKQEYNFKSEIKLEKYTLDLNSKEIKTFSKNLKLTEKEINIILFLKSKNKPQKIEVLQKEVWGYLSDLETHTVETHVYRLRKKIKDTFKDEEFIISKKDGYIIS